MGAHDSFLALAAREPEKVAEAVRQARSPYQTLALLGFGGQVRRAAQLCEAAVYYGWDTSHWTKPVHTAQSFHDFASWKPDSAGENGERFEARFLEELRLQADLAGSATILSCGGAQYPTGVLYDETVVKNWLPLSSPTPPWDAVFVMPNQAVLVFEAKVSRKNGSRLRRQLRMRSKWVSEMEQAGWTVQTCIVLGTGVVKRDWALVRELDAAGCWVGGLREFNLEDWIH